MAGLPMILERRDPGQEEGNAQLRDESPAGVYAPGPGKVARAVEDWLSKGQDFLREWAENARRLARPDAVWAIADEVWSYAQQPRIEQTAVRRRRLPWLRRAGPRTRRARGSK
jgi:UDP-N-acetylglucosamine:LPS N-acetylglucosamine transferase